MAERLDQMAPLVSQPRKTSRNRAIDEERRRQVPWKAMIAALRRRPDFEASWLEKKRGRGVVRVGLPALKRTYLRWKKNGSPGDEAEPG
jgi:hypothetical protein